MSSRPTIVWTKIDEAPALATYSLLPVVQAFTKYAGVDVDEHDISLAGRVLATFQDYLEELLQVLYAHFLLASSRLLA